MDKWTTRSGKGQFSERKSCHDRPGGRARDVRSVARDLAEALSAVGNAGGTVGSAWKTTARPQGWTIPTTA